MVLGVPLSQWHDVPRHCLADYVRTETRIYRFDKEIGLTFVYEVDGSSGMFKLIGEDDTNDVPEKAYPIACTYVDGSRLWTRKKYRVRTTTPVTKHPPGRIIYNTLPRDTMKLKGASDGSLLKEKKVMTVGWLLSADTDHMMSATFVISDISSLSSYRAKLEGTFRMLKHSEYLDVSTCPPRR